MEKDIIQFEEKFKIIKKLDWIKTKRKGPTGIGYTFETLLEKEENSLEIPDFNNIEIKTFRNNSCSFLSLFNMTPDGDYLFELKRIKEKYGYPDKILKDCKILNVDVFGDKVNPITYKYLAKLKIDYEKEKIRLVILNRNLEVIDEEASWSFDVLKEKLNRKLKYLALIEANSKYINHEEYFKYENINFYKLQDFDAFLKCIEEGIIKVTIKLGVFRTGKRKGQTHDHGTSFSINKNHLHNLYKDF